MGFNRNDYLHWYLPRITRRDGAVNLHSSGVAALREHDIAPRVGNPWSMSDGFESALCSHLDLPRAELLWTPGATGGTLIALLGLTETGDEVVVESPIYEPMLRQAERACVVKRLNRCFEEGFALSLTRARELIGPRTRLVMITEPANPSGTCANPRDVLALADIAAQSGAVLLVNEVYRGFTDRPSYHGQRPNIAVVSSLSKLLGAYWMRLGWLSGPVPVIEKLRDAHLTFGAPSQCSAAYGIALCERYEPLRQAAVVESTRCLQIVDAWVKAMPEISWHTPQGPGFGCIQLPESKADDVGFATDLHDKYGVLAVPGAFFGLPGTLRLCWLQAGERLEYGLEQISKALRSEGAASRCSP